MAGEYKYIISTGRLVARKDVTVFFFGKDADNSEWTENCKTLRKSFRSRWEETSANVFTSQ
jgi:hypothetical protein